jgi:hypothetical protein
VVDTYMSSETGGAAPVTGRVLKSGANMNVDPSARSEIKQLQTGSKLPIFSENPPCGLKVSFAAAELPGRLEVVAS